MNIFKWKTAAVSGVVLMFFSGLVFANTPDGETPAEEVFCEQFDGKAKGLCNAYCEAMDCHDPLNAKASLNACNNVGDKLVAATPDFEGDVKACGIVTCPCAGHWDSGGGALNVPALSAQPDDTYLDPVFCGLGPLGLGGQTGVNPGDFFYNIESLEFPGTEFCSLGVRAVGGQSSNIIDLTPEGLAACVALLDQKGCQINP